jgi:hypothetical protein
MKFYTHLDKCVSKVSVNFKLNRICKSIINIIGVSTPGVPGPTSKFVAARPSPDGLARDGTQGEKRGSCYLAPGGCARSRGYKRSRERESEPIR